MPKRFGSRPQLGRSGAYQQRDPRRKGGGPQQPPRMYDPNNPSAGGLNPNYVEGAEYDEGINGAWVDDPNKNFQMSGDGKFMKNSGGIGQNQLKHMPSWGTPTLEQSGWGGGSTWGGLTGTPEEHRAKRIAAGMSPEAPEGFVVEDGAWGNQQPTGPDSDMNYAGGSKGFYADGKNQGTPFSEAPTPQVPAPTPQAPAAPVAPQAPAPQTGSTTPLLPAVPPTGIGALNQNASKIQLPSAVNEAMPAPMANSPMSSFGSNGQNSASCFAKGGLVKKRKKKTPSVARRSPGSTRAIRGYGCSTLKRR